MAPAAYRFTATKDPYDGTSAIIVEDDGKGDRKVLELNGDPVELTEEQHKSLSENFKLVKDNSTPAATAQEPSSDASTADEQPEDTNEKVEPDAPVGPRVGSRR